jgi:hypothetical protein
MQQLAVLALLTLLALALLALALLALALLALALLAMAPNSQRAPPNTTTARTHQPRNRPALLSL